jgi:hypothetical protein
MSHVGLPHDASETYIMKELNKKAENFLNKPNISNELQMEATRSRIEKLRWYHSGLIHVKRQSLDD